MPNYQNGKIYVIRNHVNDKVYVGSTTMTLSQRMSHHRRTAQQKPAVKLYAAFHELGIEKFYIELLETFPCDTVHELMAKEGYHMRLINSVRNGYNCYCSRGCRTKREYESIPDVREKKTSPENCKQHSLHKSQKYWSSPEERDRRRQYSIKKWATDPIYREKSRLRREISRSKKREGLPSQTEKPIKEKKSELDIRQKNNERIKNKYASDPQERARRKQYSAQKYATDAAYREKSRLRGLERRRRLSAKPLEHLAGDETFQKDDATNEN